MRTFENIGDAGRCGYFQLIHLWLPVSLENRLFENRPPLFACNLTHGQNTILVGIFRQPTTMGLSLLSPPLCENRGLTFFQKEFPKFKFI